MNKGVVDQLVASGIMQLLDYMTKINRALYTREDQVSHLTIRMTKEHIKNDQERDQNINWISWLKMSWVLVQRVLML